MQPMYSPHYYSQVAAQPPHAGPFANIPYSQHQLPPSQGINIMGSVTSDVNGMSGGENKSLEQKRKQVKNACANCQKACKKCDEGRPCSRCLKYGLIDTCIDSTRKERKKGVKRGPYKRRQQHNQSNDISQVQNPSANGGMYSILPTSQPTGYALMGGSSSTRTQMPYTYPSSSMTQLGQQYESYQPPYGYGFPRNQLMPGQYLMPPVYPPPNPQMMPYNPNMVPSHYDLLASRGITHPPTIPYPSPPQLPRQPSPHHSPSPRQPQPQQQHQRQVSTQHPHQQL